MQHMIDDDWWGHLWRFMMMTAMMVHDDGNYDVWLMIMMMMYDDHDDDVWWWLVTDDDYDDDHLIPWSWWWAYFLVDWRSTIFISYFHSYNFHQPQLPYPASSSQLPFAIDAKGGEMSMLGGAHLEGELVVSCHQWQRGRLLVSLSLAWSVSLVLSLMSSESLIEVLMSTKSLLWSCPWFRPFVEPLVCACLCGVWETFSSDSSPSLKPLGALEMSQKPLWVG